MMTKKNRVVLAMLCALIQSGVLAKAADWPNWRGPYYNGTSDAANLPDTLTPDNAVWSLTLPGPAASTPAIAGGKLF